jgi:hypothetical protein
LNQLRLSSSNPQVTLVMMDGGRHDRVEELTRNRSKEDC